MRAFLLAAVAVGLANAWDISSIDKSKVKDALSDPSQLQDSAAMRGLLKQQVKEVANSLKGHLFKNLAGLMGELAPDRVQQPCRACPPPVLERGGGGEFKRLLVLLAFYRAPQPPPPVNESQALHDSWMMCDGNVRFFYAHGLSAATTDVIVTAIGDSVAPPKPPKSANVEILRLRCNLGTDLHAHAAVLRHVATKPGGLDRYSHFVMLNCGTRGPYVRADALERCPNAFGGWLSEQRDGPLWLAPFASRLDGPGNVALVGASLSLQHNAHVQSHMLASSRRHVEVLMRAWPQDAICEVSSAARAEAPGASAHISTLHSRPFPPAIFERVCSRRDAAFDAHGIPMRADPRLRSMQPPPCVTWRPSAEGPHQVSLAAGERRSIQRRTRRLVSFSVVNETEIHLSQLVLGEGAQIASLMREQQGWDLRGCVGKQHSLPTRSKSKWEQASPLASLGLGVDPYEAIFVKFGGNIMSTMKLHPRACACLRRARHGPTPPAGVRRLARAGRRSRTGRNSSTPWA